MKVINWLKIVVMIISVSFIFNKTVSAESLTLPTYSKIYDDQRDPFKDAVLAIKLAKETDRNVLIEIGGTWCTWCHKMDAFLEKNPQVYHNLYSNFVVLKVSVSDSNENAAFMESMPPVLGYPHMYISTNTGKMILSKDTAELQSNGEYSTEFWLAFLDKWKVNNEIVKKQQG